MNHAWSSIQCALQVHYDSPGPFSDHSPAIIRLGSSPAIGRRCFKFFNMWGLHENFLDLTADSWNLEVYGSPMFVLCSKLKRLKLPLKELGKHHYSHISERVTSMEGELRHFQESLQDDRDNSQLLDIERQMRSKLVHLKSAEKMFFSQKLKFNYFKDCDRGTSFFHAIMGQKQRKRFIASIMSSNGVPTNSESEVGAEFVKFYQNLLGVTKDRCFGSRSYSVWTVS